MMIITDSASDILQSEAETLDIRLVQLDIMLGGEHFDRNSHEMFDRFYTLLAERDDFPTTSQPSVRARFSMSSRTRAAASGSMSKLVETEGCAVCMSKACSRSLQNTKVLPSAAVMMPT